MVFGERSLKVISFPFNVGDEATQKVKMVDWGSELQHVERSLRLRR